MKLAIVGSGMIVNDFLPIAKDITGLTSPRLSVAPQAGTTLSS